MVDRPEQMDGSRHPGEKLECEPGLDRVALAANVKIRGVLRIPGRELD
jgi:hypothetical protein